jgi:hypothetical protein
MVAPSAAMGYAFGDDGLPDDDSDIDAVLGADEDEDMDELGAMSGMMLTPTVSSSSAVGHDYPNRKAYVEAAVNAVSSGRLGRVNLVRLWKLVKVRRGLPSPAEIKAGAPITLDMALPQFSVTSSFGDSGSPEDGLNNDVLGIDDDFDADDGEEDFGLLPTIVAVTAARRVGFGNPTAYAKYRKQFNSKISRGFPIRGARLDWKQINRSWDQMSKDERKGLASPKEILADIAMKSSKTLEAASEATGFGVPEIKELISKRKAEVMGYSFGDDDLPDDDSDIDAVLGADDDDDMDDLGADDDDDMDDLGADEDDDEDFGLDNIEMDLDLDMQRALVNRYSGADQPFPAGGAAPFPGPRMAGHEVF